MRGKAHHLRAVKASDTVRDAPEHSPRTSEDAATTMPAGRVELVAFVLGPSVGATALTIWGAALGYTPEAPLISTSPWLMGTPVLPAIGVTLLAFGAIAWLVHFGIWLPAKIIFALDWLKKTLVGVVAHYAVGGAVLLFIAMGVVGILYLSPEAPVARTKPVRPVEATMSIPASDRHVAPMLGTLRQIKFKRAAGRAKRNPRPARRGF